MKKYLITGGDGRFAKELKKSLNGKKFIYLSKKSLNILSREQIKKKIKQYRPYGVIHLAGLSRPMVLHEKNIERSISLNIIGTSNIVIECAKRNIKVIYFSTNYIYPGVKGNYSETSPLLPLNNYSWSKLGGESAVQMYKNSLILRIAMSEKPWVHPKAFSNIKTNFLYHDEVIRILPKLLLKKGIINIGGKDKSIFNFAKKTNKNVKKSLYKKNKTNVRMQKDSSINIKKLKKILSKY